MRADPPRALSPSGVGAPETDGASAAAECTLAAVVVAPTGARTDPGICVGGAQEDRPLDDCVGHDTDIVLEDQGEPGVHPPARPGRGKAGSAASPAERGIRTRQGRGNRWRQESSVRAPLVDGQAVATLPKLPRGVYRVRATLLGNSRVGEAKSQYRTLTVLAPVNVGLSLYPTQVAPGQRATASVEVSSRRRSVFGNVSVGVAGAGGSWTVEGQVRDGHASVSLAAPSEPGSYRVRATFAGAKKLASGTSASVVLTVTATPTSPATATVSPSPTP